MWSGPDRLPATGTHGESPKETPVKPILGLDAFAARIAFVWAALLGAEAAAVLLACRGLFFFSLDDPYIHLAVAHNLLHGVYGVNANEVSSPSSSILWPWLLAATEFLGLGAAGPFLLNVVAAGATVTTALRLVRRAGVVDPGLSAARAYTIAIGLVFATSAIALPLTGLEHCWHVLTVVLSLEGLDRAADGEAPRARFLLALFLMPLVRFEGIAFAGASLVALAALGYRREALATAVAIGVALTAYGVYMTRIGLPLLPSSVLLKSSAASSLGAGPSAMLHALAQRLVENLHEGRAIVLALALAFLVYVAYAVRDRTRRLAVYIPVIAAIGAHLLVGAYGWFYRYEVYVIALALLTVLLGLADLGRTEAGAPISTLRIAALVVIFALPYIVAVVRTPGAAANVYEQQYQMGRFARDIYQRPVGVNDLGLVSWRNAHYVLDLYGLGSESVRKLRIAHVFGPADIERLTDEYDVGLVMVYEYLYANGAPKSWSKIAALHTPAISGAGDTVAFFMTSKGDRQYVLTALQTLRRTLPSEDKLDIAGDGG